MPMTRADYAEVYKHITEELMGLTDTSPIILALEGAQSNHLLGLLSLRIDGIPTLSYYPPRADDATEDPPPRHLASGDQTKLRCFVVWARRLYKNNHQTPLEKEEWLRIAASDFDEFCLSGEADPSTPVRPPSPPPRPPSVPSSPMANMSLGPRPPDPVADFRKGVKRDASMYPRLKDMKHWANWHRQVISIARTHDVIEVFDPAYRPRAVQESELFQLKQAFVYSVFLDKVEIDEGKTIVRKHEAGFDAQKVYADLLQYATESTSAELQKDKLTEFLTTTQLNSSWRGTTEGFILHWHAKMSQFEDITPVNEHYTDAAKKRMLINAVNLVLELRSVHQLDQHQVTIGKTPLSYIQYLELIKSAAVQRDSVLQLPAARSRRTVNFTDIIGEQELIDYNHSYVDSDLNLFDTSFEVNRMQTAQMQPYRTVKNTQQVAATPPQRHFLEKRLWDALPDETKRALRGVPTKPAPGQPVRIQLHESGYDDTDVTEYHEVESIDEDPDDNAGQVDETDDGNDNDDDPTALLAHITQRKTLPPGHSLRTFLAATHTGVPSKAKAKDKPSSTKAKPKDSIMYKGKRYVANTHSTCYQVANVDVEERGALIDRGANGGLAGADTRLLEKTTRYADVKGINNHTVLAVPIGTAAGVVTTHVGPVCIIMHQHAYQKDGATILSALQMERFGIDVNDRSFDTPGGRQALTTPDGYVIPLQFRNGLPYMDMHPPTDQELADLPHVVLTADVDWDPKLSDTDLHIDQWANKLLDLDPKAFPNPRAYGNPEFDAQGYYRSQQVFQLSILDSVLDIEKSNLTVDDLIDKLDVTYAAYPQHVVPTEPDFEALRPNFAWLPTDIIKKTFETTTRWARHIEQWPFRKHFKSRFPALNVHRRSEPVATDTVYSDTPAVDSGVTVAQLFVGTETLVTDVYGLKTDSEFVQSLEDNIRKRGAMSKLVSDRAQVEIVGKVKDILRNLFIDAWQSEPYHEHQNPAERRYQTVKSMTNKVLDRTGAPAYCWLLAMLYVCFILNHVATASLGYQTPLFQLTGVTTDISILLNFQFYEPVYYATAAALKYEGKPAFPSEVAEGKGRFVGFGDSVGDVLTYKILTDDTHKIIYRSYVRSALNEEERNRRLDPDVPEKTVPEIIKSPRTPDGKERKVMITFKPDDLINRTYLTAPDDQGQQFRAKILEKIVENENAREQDPEMVKFRVRVAGEKVDEIVAYNDIIDFIEDEMRDPAEKMWAFKDIVAHEGPLLPTDPSYKGSSYNVMVAWEDGSKTYEPLSGIAADSPVVCAIYAQRNGLLDLPGWKRFKAIAKNQRKMTRMLNQAKLASFRREPQYQYGYRVPRTVKEAILFDQENGNTYWQDAIALEMAQLQEHQTFTNLGRGAKPPDGHKKIRVHFVFAVKHDGRHRARLVADGHLTDTPIDSVYSGVVSLRSLRIVIFLAELNDLELYGADVSNAYLEAKTKEKVYIIGGDGFGEELQGCTLVIYKALYGLKSSGKRWHERLYDVLRELGFSPSKADSDVWMRKMNDHYEYIAVYVDDLAIASKNPLALLEKLQVQCRLNLKGVGPLTFHLGCDFARDEDGTLYYGPRRYIEKILETYKKNFGEDPHQKNSPMVQNDHPEIDDSAFLEPTDVKLYQSMIGELQWCIALGRFEILPAVMTMGRFRVCPRHGHLECVKRIYGFLRKYKHGAIRVRTGMPPDMEETSSEQEDDWEYSVYGNVTELLPTDAPEPLGKPVQITTFEDANLYHDLLTGRAVTGILHFLNGTPIDWYSKRQDTVETATYGSEFVAARIATEQIIDLRTSLRYLGVPLTRPAHMFGDNQSVIISATIPHSRLNKRHNALSYHRVREAVAAKILRFFHVSGQDNPADILSKHCGYAALWTHLKPLLFWLGDTTDCPEPEIEIEERLEI